MPRTAPEEQRPAPCIFCAIAEKSAPASFVEERPEALAFLSIGPLRPGHTLIAPRRHVVELVDARPSELATLFELAAGVARRQRLSLGSQGETLFLASGAAGEQSVSHLHLHVVPRTLDDGLDLTGWWERRAQQVALPELEAVARALRDAPIASS